MSVLSDLIEKIKDPDLRARLSEEVARMQKQKKFGLVFEEHLPEATPLYDTAISVGSLVSLKDKEFKEFFRVKQMKGETLVCEREDDRHEEVEINKSEAVAVAMFGHPIYPCLKPMDAVKNAPDSDLWHTLIEADNYHALQLLVYLYGGMVDCIYIDPPYNTGDKSWKYNNNYVDNSDSFRHSKWLSMMKKRLVLAKKLLNPKDSVLVVTIDEKEYLRLGCLLEEMFPEARIQMVTDVTSPRAGASRDNEFSRCEEYIYIIQFGTSTIARFSFTGMDNDDKRENNSPIWFSLLRTGNHSSRNERPNLFYPIWITFNGKLHSVGDPLALNQHLKELIPPQEDLVCLLPIRPNGEENTWNLSSETLRVAFEEGTARIRHNKGKYTVSYLRRAEKRRIENGELECYGRDEDGSWLIRKKENIKRVTTTKSVWMAPSHDAGIYGTILIKSILCNKRFDFPKSLYAVHDTIRFFVANKPNALIVDFFAGSGTTLQAVNLLNAEDGGKRCCIMVTNNEVSEAEAKSLKKKGYKPGDDEWEKWGIARYVNWPRTVCSIEGHDINGNPLKGNYLGSDIPMSDGFAANAQFFKLSFLDKNAVAMDMQFKELLTILWMKAGAIGECPSIEGSEIEDFFIFPENKMAILKEEDAYRAFKKAIKEQDDISTVFIITDSDGDFREMSAEFSGKKCYQLYRDYLDNFSINYERNV